MASTPPAEFPTPTPDFDQPDAPGHEIDTPAPDTDIPSPQPDSTPNMGFAMPTSSDVGTRAPGDTSDIGGTADMTASTGGLAGTSR